MSNIRGRNYESILKLITESNFILKDSKSDYKDRTIWNRISELTILMEKYFAMKELLSDPGIERLFAIKQLRKRNIKDLFVSGLNKYITELNNAPLSKNTLDLKQELYTEAAFFSITGNDLNEYKRYKELFEINYMTNVIITAIIFNFDTLVLQINDVKMNSDLTNLLIKSVGIRKIINTIISVDKNLGNQILMLYELSITLNKKEKNYLFKAKEFFYKNIDNNSEEFNELVFRFLLNYCIKKIETEPEKHEDILLELFEKKIKHNFYRDMLDPNPALSHFSEFVLLSARKKISLLNLYMKIVFPHVKPADRSEIEFYVEAIRSFYFGDYERSLGFLNKINKKHFIHYFDYFRFSSMIYFETSRFVELSQGLTNFKTYVKRHKEFSENAKLKIFNYFFCLNLLANYKENRSIKFSDLEFQIKESTPVLEREWLLKQLSKLR